jgi:pyruvate,water dikinase
MLMTDVITGLPSAADATRLGGKATNLQRLLQHGFPVPAAVVITADAYRTHVAREDVTAALRASRFADARAAIEAMPLDSELIAQITAALPELGDAPIAVRSSATSEDGRAHSFAGQHDTVLAVRGLDGVCAAIRRCWASLWSDRAVAYRERAALDHADVAMAVVLQRCIPADVSGVLFTCDPVSGRTDRIVIEATLGLGEILVSGRVAPDRFVVDKASLATIERTSGAKTIALIADATGGTRERAVRPEHAQSLCLSDAMASHLAEFGRQIERTFGIPQDIEWAVAGDQVWLLQARSVTTKIAAPDPADRQVWSNTNAGEVLPGVLTPMTFSLVRRIVGALVEMFFVRLAVEVGDAPVLGLIAGRAYFNMNTFMAVMSRMPFLGGANAVELFGGDQRLAPALAALTPADVPGTHGSRWRTLARLPGLLWWLLRHLRGDTDAVMARVRRHSDVLAQVELPSLSDAALLAHIDEAFRDMADIADAFTAAAVNLSCGAPLGPLCRRWFDDTDGALANRLLAGLGGLESAEAGLALWRLAEAATAHSLQDSLVAARSFGDARRQLERRDDGRAWLTQWDSFMMQHGHHARGEVDVAVPRWREQPDYVLDLVRGYLGDGARSPLAVHRQRGVERAQLTEACRQRLADPVRRRLFGWVLRRMQRGTMLRENVKNDAVRRIAVVRAALVETGARLAARGVTSDRDDVFFLTLDELGGALHDGGERPRALIADRRTKHELNQHITPPPVVVGRFDPRRHRVTADVPEMGAESVFRGLGVSPGVAVGRARVILRADHTERVLPGEILIAPFTDPGWTPYFLTAAGIVMDLGGALSHGSVVAREYGIPAVVNVGAATRVIRTGQMLRVDGSRGEVIVLEPEAGADSST